jgi:hypothetical protein
VTALDEVTVPGPVTSLGELFSRCRAGDILLTGQIGGLSRLITFFGDAPVSHAMLCISGDVVIEARDSRWDLREQGQGVRLVKLSSLEALAFGLVVVVRPSSDVDAAALRSWAVATVDAALPFASVGLTVMAPLLVAAQVEARSTWVLSRLGPIGRMAFRVVVSRRRHMAELVADGTRRVICAELVYRGLRAAGVTIDLSEAQFAGAMADLPDGHGTVSAPGDMPTELIGPLGSAGLRPVFAITDAELTQRAVDSVVLAKRDLPRPRWRWAFAASRAGWNSLQLRAKDHPDGDDADLVTPADLLRTVSVVEIGRWPTEPDPSNSAGRPLTRRP